MKAELVGESLGLEARLHQWEAATVQGKALCFLVLFTKTTDPRGVSFATVKSQNDALL